MHSFGFGFRYLSLKISASTLTSGDEQGVVCGGDSYENHILNIQQHHLSPVFCPCLHKISQYTLNNFIEHYFLMQYSFHKYFLNFSTPVSTVVTMCCCIEPTKKDSPYCFWFEFWPQSHHSLCHSALIVKPQKQMYHICN